mmetsp:Transcript_25906/g.60703  ORF Transcript_25906/g.60703 Transcript_25906/m.60703 type:complete len:655 (-) Transcript_25906:76-2040(-)
MAAPVFNGRRRGSQRDAGLSRMLGGPAARVDPARVCHIARPRESGAPAAFDRTARAVVYWMSRSVRADANFALEYACARAEVANLPLLVLFAVCDGYPGANARHYSFLLEGVADVQRALAHKQIPMLVLRVAGASSAAELPRAVTAAALAAGASPVVMDRGYTRTCRLWRAAVASEAGALGCEVVVVESDAVVPVDLASTKLESAAATLRPKISRLLSRFLGPSPPSPPSAQSADLFALASAGMAAAATAASALPGVSVLAAPLDAGATLTLLDVDRSVPPVADARGGSTHARRALALFVRDRLKGYARHRNEPALSATSGLSAYLHFGHISPVTIARAVRAAAPRQPLPYLSACQDKFTDELIVRREQAFNYVLHQDDYDRYEGAVPRWARDTLENASVLEPALMHGDPDRLRAVCAALERGESECELWNLAQWQMLSTGCMHNYLRMYWCKSLLRWLPPRHAHALAVQLNDKYELDGRDPNGYLGIAWCFGNHDRPFPQRAVFGTVRSMGAASIRKKKDINDLKALVLRQCAEAVARTPELARLLPAAALSGGQQGLSRFLRPAVMQATSAEPPARPEAGPAHSRPETEGDEALAHALHKEELQAHASSPRPEAPRGQLQTRAAAGSADGQVAHKGDIRNFFQAGGKRARNA